MGAPGAAHDVNGGAACEPVPSFASASMGAPFEPPAAGLAAPAPSPVPEDAPTPDAWVPRDPSLLRLTGRHPFNCEARMQDLLESGPITKTALHFVRNHGAVPRRAWGEHTLTLAGHVGAPQTLTMDEIIALPARSLTVTMACAGNRRKEQNMHRKSQGFNWGPSGVSTALWTGVMLRDVLLRAVVDESRASSSLHVHFAGPPGELPKGDGTYGTSIPLAYALNPAHDVLLAYKQNGRWLAPDHGFPLRVILPGHIGGRTVKWLTRVEVRDAPSANWYHENDNRVPPPHVLTPEDAVAEGVWGNPDWVINHLNINSAILAPAHDAVVPLATDAGVEFRGYAYSGGGRKVTRVELSTDKGATWRPASIERVEPPTAHGMHWTWVWWRLTLSVAELAACGEVALRAADSSMNVQPSALTWSLLGMMGNQHYVVRTAVHRSDDGALGLRFQHPAPIQAGALGTSGWREEEAAAKAPTEPATPPQSEAALPSRRGSARVVARAELERHTGDDSVWFAYRGKVYDGTAFLDAHPGGADSILIAGGQDATEDFDAIHSAKAKTMLDAYYVGELVSDDEGEDADGSDGADAAPAVVADLDPPALDPRKKVIFRLISRTALSPNVVLLRFGLPTPTTRLGLPVGKHVFLYGTPATGEVVRAYTPTSSDADRGAIDFVVKMYDDSLGGGVMSRWLGGLKVGDAVAAKGPVGHFVYEGAAACVVNRRKVAARSLTFIAAGTGITPCYAVLRAAIDEEGKDGVPLHLLYANRHEDDVLLMDKLDELQQAAGARLTVTHTLSRPKETWPHRRGRIDAAMLADVVPKAGEGRLVLLCGPRALVEDVCKPAMKALGHADENVVVF